MSSRPCSARMRSTSSSHLVGNEMIDLHGDALAAGRRHQLRRFLDRLGPAVFGLLAARRPAGHVDGGAGGAQFDGDAAARAARRAGDQRDLSLQGHRHSPIRVRVPVVSTGGSQASIYINDYSVINGSQDAPTKDAARRGRAGGRARLIHERGPEALTFASLARACGLSPPRWCSASGARPGSSRAPCCMPGTGSTRRPPSSRPRSRRPPTARSSCWSRSRDDYGGIEAYAEGLLVLREDLRDPALRARGAAWKAALSRSARRLLRRRRRMPRRASAC